MGHPIMELRHVMRFWMAIAISLGLRLNMNACALVLHYWSRLLLLLLLLLWVSAFCSPFSLVFFSFYLFCWTWHVFNFPLFIQRDWKNDAHMAIRDCYAARKIDNSSYKALFYMSEALSQVIPPIKWQKTHRRVIFKLETSKIDINMESSHKLYL